MVDGRPAESNLEQLQECRWNNFILNAKERSERKITLKSMPPSVMLPTGRRCNLRCRMCIDRSSPSQFEDLSLEDFRQLAPQLESASSIAIYGWGEPFLNRNYREILEHIAKLYPGVIIHISTNGTLLKENIIDLLIGKPNIFLNISINAASRETYNEVMGLDLFDVVIRNIRRLIQKKQETGSSSPVLTLSFVILRANFHELPLFYELGRDLGVDDVLISDLMLLEDDHLDLLVDGLADQVRDAYGEAKRLQERRQGPTLTPFTDMPYLPAEAGNICLDPWESFKIGDDGGVSICCYANRTFGNVFEQSVAEIWNSEDVRHYRATVNTDNPPLPCRTCPKKRALLRGCDERSRSLVQRCEQEVRTAALTF